MCIARSSDNVGADLSHLPAAAAGRFRTPDMSQTTIYKIGLTIEPMLCTLQKRKVYTALIAQATRTNVMPTNIPDEQDVMYSGHG